MLASSLASYYFALLLHFSTRYLLYSDSFRYSLPTSFKTLPISSDRSPEDVVESMKQAENACRERHDNRAILALFLPAPEHPVPQPCGPLISANRTACRETSPTHLYGSKCLPIPPIDFPAGSYLRLGPGGYSKDDGIFDGDGIVLCITIPPKCLRPSDILFSSTYVDTAGRQRERKLRSSTCTSDGYLKYKGSLANAPRGWPVALAMLQNMMNFRTTQALKDTCNTALAEHGGRVLALMEQSPPTEIEITKSGEVRTKECMTRLDGAIPSAPLTGGNLGAHGKYDYKTGQQIHVSYDPSVKPFIRVDVFEEQVPTSKRRGWQLRQTTRVNIPTPVMMHDFALTKKYVVLLDFPLTVRPSRMIFDEFPVQYEPENGARIGLLPRRENGLIDSNQEIKWYECQTGVTLHTVNAYEVEEAGKVVLHAFRASPSSKGSYIETQAPSCLYEWVIDLRNGLVVEHCLNPDTLVEFPIVNSHKRGRDLTYSYGLRYYSIGGPLTDVIAAPQDGITFDGIVKFAMTENSSPGMRKGDIADKFILPKNWYAVTEACIIPKESNGGKAYSEKPLEHAYLAFIATHVPQDDRTFLEIGSDENSMKSHFLILDADNLEEGPVSVIELPVSVRGGLHSMYLEWDKLA